MTNDDDWLAIEAMIIYGGSFAAGLGRLLQIADSENKARLLHAFPEMMAHYREAAGHLKERRRTLKICVDRT